MVPARVESTPMAPEISVMATRKTKTQKLVNLKDVYTSNATTVIPATTKEIFCVTNHSCKTCKIEMTEDTHVKIYGVLLQICHRKSQHIAL